MYPWPITRLFDIHHCADFRKVYFMNTAFDVSESAFWRGIGGEHVWIEADEGVGNGCLLEKIEIRFGPKERRGPSHS
jgi:hypothetical protein